MNEPLQKPRRRAHAGFSLIELLVVIVILGILGTVAGVAIFPNIFKARATKAREMILELDKAIKMYALDNTSRKPGSLDELVEPTETSETGYLESNQVPFDPWGNPFEYRAPSSPTGDDYDIICLGEDGVEGGDGKGRDITLYDIKNPQEDQYR